MDGYMMMLISTTTRAMMVMLVKLMMMLMNQVKASLRDARRRISLHGDQISYQTYLSRCLPLLVVNTFEKSTAECMQPAPIYHYILYT